MKIRGVESAEGFLCSESGRHLEVVQNLRKWIGGFSKVFQRPSPVRAGDVPKAGFLKPIVKQIGDFLALKLGLAWQVVL